MMDVAKVGIEITVGRNLNQETDTPRNQTWLHCMRAVVYINIGCENNRALVRDSVMNFRTKISFAKISSEAF